MGWDEYLDRQRELHEGPEVDYVVYNVTGQHLDEFECKDWSEVREKVKELYNPSNELGIQVTKTIYYTDGTEEEEFKGEYYVENNKVMKA